MSTNKERYLTSLSDRTILKPWNHPYSVSHEPYGIKNKDGWNKVNTTRSVINISTSHMIEDYKLSSLSDQEKIEFLHFTIDEITLKIANELKDGNLVNFSEYKDPFSGNLILKADINVIPFGERFVNVQETSFVVDEQKFTNDELVEAVRKAYPERFI